MAKQPVNTDAFAAAAVAVVPDAGTQVKVPTDEQGKSIRAALAAAVASPPPLHANADADADTPPTANDMAVAKAVATAVEAYVQVTLVPLRCRVVLCGCSSPQAVRSSDHFRLTAVGDCARLRVVWYALMMVVVV